MFRSKVIGFLASRWVHSLAQIPISIEGCITASAQLMAYRGFACARDSFDQIISFAHGSYIIEDIYISRGDPSGPSKDRTKQCVYAGVEHRLHLVGRPYLHRSEATRRGQTGREPCKETLQTVIHEGIVGSPLLAPFRATRRGQTGASHAKRPYILSSIKALSGRPYLHRSGATRQGRTGASHSKRLRKQLSMKALLGRPYAYHSRSPLHIL